MSIVIDLAALLWILSRQVRARPLQDSYTLPLVLGVVGLLEFSAFFMGGGMARGKPASVTP